MGYLGTPPQSGFITTAKQRVTGSTNAYVDLDHSISSLADVIVWVNYVKQDATNLTLTTSTRITLGATLVSGDVVEIAFLGKAVSTQTPDTGTVTNDMLAGSIGQSKLSNEVINEAKMQISNAPTNGYMLTAQSGNTGGLTWGSASTSAAGTVTLDNVFSSSYRNYKVIGHIRTDQSTYVKWRTRAGGSNNDGDQYITLERTHYIKDDQGQASTEYGNFTTTFGYFAYGGIAANGDVTGSYCGFDLTFFNPYTDDNMTRHMVTGLITFRSATDNRLYTSHIAGSATANHNADGLRFETNAGNVDMHRIDVYGMVNS